MPLALATSREVKDVDEQTLPRQDQPARRCHGNWLWTVVLLPAFALGCAAPIMDARVQEDIGQPTSSQAAPSSATIDTVQRTGEQKESKEVARAPRKITLPMAIELCVNRNFRLLAGAEKMRQAEADWITASLIPNASLFADYQLIPLQHADINNQLGPPQSDVMVAVPIDWLLFGKRVAAMRATQVGIQISNADYADLHRLQVGRTVDAFYEILANKKYLELADENLEELRSLEKLTKELARNKKAGAIELDRAKLAVLEAFLERHDRERAFVVSKARLRPFIGLATDVDFEVDGVLAIPTVVVPPPKLEDAVALAEKQRPDLLSAQHQIDRAAPKSNLSKARPNPRLPSCPV